MDEEFFELKNKYVRLKNRLGEVKTKKEQVIIQNYLHMIHEEMTKIVLNDVHT